MALDGRHGEIQQELLGPTVTRTTLFAGSPMRAADLLGNGQRVRADDTTCAITGGIVAARTGLDGVPRDWLRRREPLPGPGIQTD